jgi:hypothetical protein
MAGGASFMNIILFQRCSICYLIARKRDATAAEGKMKMEPEYLRDFARRYTMAWCSQDAASVAAFYSPNGSLRINEDTPAVGRTAIKASVQQFMTAFPDLKILMDGLEIQNDRAIYRWTLVGTNAGPGGTGKHVRISGYDEWQIGSDGLIAESKGHFDVADYQSQLK